MNLWLSVIGAAIVVAVAGTWLARHGSRNRRGSDDLDRESLPEDQLGL